MGVPMRQAILQSGSLYLSPPILRSKAEDLAATVEVCLHGLSPPGGPAFTLQNAPVELILKVLADVGYSSWYLQMEPGLENWRTKLGHAERLLVGDCEYEVSYSLQDSCRVTYM